MTALAAMLGRSHPSDAGHNRITAAHCRPGTDPRREILSREITVSDFDAVAEFLGNGIEADVPGP